MKKSIVFILIAVLAVSFSSTGSTAPKFIKKAKEKITGKDHKKKKAAPVPVSKNTVLVKGLHLTWCGREVTDDGLISIPGLDGVTLPVKNGKFDLTVPGNPVFGDEWGLSQQSDMAALSFESAKVYLFCLINFENSNTSESEEGKARGRGAIGFRIIYSDKDVNGTIDGEPASLKKGWNIIGDKTNLEASLMCAG
ncbi:MAG TPA: hypothetical protein PKZ64_16150 [Spirochaetota bacterium]|nr:hypothetical protein [Spirochaetota bacterium]